MRKSLAAILVLLMIASAFFVISEDIFAASSSNINLTVQVQNPDSDDDGGGGSGGGGTTTPVTYGTAVFKGFAYPGSVVTLLKDAQVAATTTAGSNAQFEVTVGNLSGGNYIFSLYSEDKNGIRSALLTFQASITAGSTTIISGIFISPTIESDKSEVKLGDNITFFGQSIPGAEILININSETPIFKKIVAGGEGAYTYQFDTSVIEIGSHSARSKADAGGGIISAYGKSVGFIIGTQNISKTTTSAKGDLNTDNKVNLIDFSILAYWYQRSSPPADKDLNGDGKIDLIDFSIIAYYWTG